MTGGQVLAVLKSRGVVLEPQGDRLHYRAPRGILTPELRQALAEHKAEIMALLRRPRLVLAPPRWHAEEVGRRVEEEGVCVFWSDVLREMIAFVKDEAYLDKVPAGVVVFRPDELELLFPQVSPNPPKDTDGRREDSGRGWVRELQGRWPGVLG